MKKSILVVTLFVSVVTLMPAFASATTNCQTDVTVNFTSVTNVHNQVTLGDGTVVNSGIPFTVYQNGAAVTDPTLLPSPPTLSIRHGDPSSMRQRW